MQLNNTVNHHGKKKLTFRSFVKEARIFLVFFFIATIVILIVTNANLFVTSFHWLFDTSIVRIPKLSEHDISQNKDISSLLDQQVAPADIETLLDSYHLSGTDNSNIIDTQEGFLIARIREYPFDFNTLAPVNKLIIPSLGIDIPIIEPKTMSTEDFLKANYDEELKQWVVKYPTTPAPWTSGNSLIFGHTSQEFRKHNPYSMIFKGIPKLENGDNIQVVWDNNLYQYEVVDKFIVLPSQVNAQYLSYHHAGASYITLMGCYPLGTDKKRIMVVAKLVK